MKLKERIKAALTPRNMFAWICVVLGVVIMSAGFVLFTNPYKIIPGGVYGLVVCSTTSSPPFRPVRSVLCSTCR